MPDDYDELIGALTREVLTTPAEVGFGPARLALIEVLACVFEAQEAGAPAACLAPLLPGATLAGGARVPGSSLELEPSQAAWCLTYLCGNASIGALLPLLDYLARRAVLDGARPPRVGALLQACMQAQGLAERIALPEPHAAAGVAAALALRVALAGVAARLCGGGEGEVAAALCLAFADGLALHDGSPRACAAVASGAVRAALLARAGMPPVHRILTAYPDGFHARLLGGGSVALHPASCAAAATVGDPLLAAHRFELAVRRRFADRQAERVLAAVHADAAFETQPMQSFVALLVRP